VIDNALTQTLSKSSKCKLQVQEKAPIGADIADGDRFICLAEADINAVGGLLVGGQSVVMTGEMFKGKMKLKADLSEIQCGVLEFGEALSVLAQVMSSGRGVKPVQPEPVPWYIVRFWCPTMSIL